MRCVIQESSGNREWIRFQTILEARIRDLERAIRRRDGIAIEQHADQLDELQQASQRDLEISNLNRESQQLREVRCSSPHKGRELRCLRAMRRGYSFKAARRNTLDCPLH